MKVRTAYPPAAGDFARWDWPTFYNAVLAVMQNPSSLEQSRVCLKSVRNLPAPMVLTEPMVTAAWARFIEMYPQHDRGLAYQYMLKLLRAAGRLADGDTRQWYDYEDMWQAIESQLSQMAQAEMMQAASSPFRFPA